MANKQVKRRSTSLATRKTEVKIIMIHHLTPTRMAVSKRQTKGLARMGETGAPHPRLVGIENGAAAIENSFLAVPQTNTELPHDPAVMLLSTYPKETKTYVHIKTYTHMGIAA